MATKTRWYAAVYLDEVNGKSYEPGAPLPPAYKPTKVWKDRGTVTKDKPKGTN